MTTEKKCIAILEKLYKKAKTNLKNKFTSDPIIFKNVFHSIIYYKKKRRVLRRRS